VFAKKNNNNKIVVIILLTTDFNVQKFSVFPKVCIYFIVIRRDSDDFPVKNERNNLRNRSGVFSMHSTN